MTIQQLFTALYARLSGDATLTGLATGGIHRDLAAEGSALPYVIMGLQAHEDTYTLGARSYATATIMLRGVCDGGSAAAAEQIIDRIDTLLSDYDLVVGGSPVLSIRRSGRLAYAEVDPTTGRRYNHAVATFEVMA